MKLLKDLFTLEEKSDHSYVLTLANKSHPVFKAHFLGNEILAGFLQIDIISLLMCHKITLIKKAKFLEVIRPEDVLKLNITSKDNIKYKVIIYKENKKMSEIIYEI